jgi:glutamyl-tRNA(Gln) amidotransferase subunit D
MSDIGHYGGKVEEVLESLSVDVGDRVRVEKEDRSPQEGLLMPGDRSGQTDHIVIKLDNGYNIGIEVTENTSVEKIPTKND